MEEPEERLIKCNICKGEGLERHPYDKKACIPCGTEYFLSIRPDLTVWMEGLDAQDKSKVLKDIMQEFFIKERSYKSEAEAAKRSCHAAYAESQHRRFSCGI